MTQQPVEVQELGFDSWFELYEWVKEQGLEEQAKITLTWPKPPPSPISDALDLPVPDDERPDVTLALNTIRANAFREVYPTLLSKSKKEIFYDMLKLPTLTRREIDLIRVAIANLPTKMNE